MFVCIIRKFRPIYYMGNIVTSVTALIPDEESTVEHMEAKFLYSPISASYHMICLDIILH